MFIGETHLPQLLKPEHYFAADQHEVEIQQLFKPGWHCVGTLADLPRAGSYLTLTLLGVPLLVRRGTDGVQAY